MTTLTTRQLIARYGNPMTDNQTFQRKFMVMWTVPQDIRAAIPVLPVRMYVNKDIQRPLEAALRECINQGVHGEIKTWDGCFVIRRQRGSSAISRHSWGIAIDFNAKENPLVRGVTPATRPALRKAKVKWSEKFLDCWRKHNWVCGADWQTVLDGMHFEYTMTNPPVF